MVGATAARTWGSVWLRPEVSLPSGALRLPRVLHTATWALTGRHEWRTQQVYPIIVAISGACGMCVFQCARHLTQSPDVSISKTERAMGVKEEKHFFKEGERFREHGLRRCGARTMPLGLGARVAHSSACNPVETRGESRRLPACLATRAVWREATR